MKITLSGLLHHSGGYSELTRNLALVLNDLGVLASIDALDKGNFQGMPLDTFCSKEYLELEAKLAKDADKTYAPKADTILQVTPPFMFKPAPAGIKKNIGITMFETRVPKDWFTAVNNLTHLVVHDQFQQDLFKKYAAVDIHRWTPYVSNPHEIGVDLRFGQPDAQFLLTVGVARVHKNQSKIIQAFNLIRKEFPKVKLVIKAITEEQQYDDYRALVAGDSDIIVIPSNYSTVAMDNLYQRCAAYVSASMCEGLDMPAIKAAMCGKPIIAGWHTGHMSWVPEKHLSLITKKVDMSGMHNIHPRYREPDMCGYDCDVPHLAEHMHVVLSGAAEIEAFKIPEVATMFSRIRCTISIGKLLKDIA